MPEKVDRGIAGIVQSQRDYFLSGKTLPVKTRKAHLRSLRMMLKENEERIADAVYQDYGKSYYEVIENEISLVYVEITLTTRNLNRWSRPHRPWPSLISIPARTRVYSQPYGNVLCISAWNYPVQLALIPVVAALAAGNTVILKPSEISGHTSRLLAELINSRFPPEVFYAREGGVGEAQELLAMRFDKIFFTGSSRVGKIVMKAAAEHLTPVTLELGGKNPVIVMPDCNLKMAAKRLVWGKFHNGGQACVSPDHIYVHEAIKDRLLEEIKLNIQKQFNGNAIANEAFPRIINEASYNRLMGLIIPEKVLVGGTGIKGDLFIEPTVMHDITEEDAIMQEEVFGPIMPFLTFNSIEELLDRLRKKPSPLAFYVFSRNIAFASEIQKQIRSGGGMINDTVVHFVNSSTPFGGLGESGMGNYHGRAGYETFCHRKTVIKKPNWFELWLKYPPYNKYKLKIIRLLLR